MKFSNLDIQEIKKDGAAYIPVNVTSIDEMNTVNTNLLCVKDDKGVLGNGKNVVHDGTEKEYALNLLVAHKNMVMEAKSILRTLKEKAINAANDTNTDADRATMQKEFDQAIDQIDENAHQTYNGQTLIDGSKEHYVPKPGTVTSMTNESLSSATTVFTNLIDLEDGDGNSLQIDSTDTMTISYVMDGKTYTASKKVEESSLIDLFSDTTPTLNDDLVVRTPLDDTVGEDEFGQTIKNPSGKIALTIQSQHYGVDHQIAGLTITFQDKYGNAKRRANALFEHLSITVKAKNPGEDHSIAIKDGKKELKMSFSDLTAYGLGFSRLNIIAHDKDNMSCADFLKKYYPEALMTKNGKIAEIAVFHFEAASGNGKWVIKNLECESLDKTYSEVLSAAKKHGVALKDVLCYNMQNIFDYPKATLGDVAAKYPDTKMLYYPIELDEIDNVIPNVETVKIKTFDGKDETIAAKGLSYSQLYDKVASINGNMLTADFLNAESAPVYSSIEDKRKAVSKILAVKAIRDKHYMKALVNVLDNDLKICNWELEKNSKYRSELLKW